VTAETSGALTAVTLAAEASAVTTTGAFAITAVTLAALTLSVPLAAEALASVLLAAIALIAVALSAVIAGRRSARSVALRHAGSSASPLTALTGIHTALLSAAKALAVMRRRAAASELSSAVLTATRLA